jgi:hypothetical protein
MIDYLTLAKILQSFESAFGGNAAVLAPTAISPVVPNRPKYSHPNVQFFALDSSTAKAQTPLPVVVLVGSNYTQLNGVAGRVVPSASAAFALTGPPFIEDHDPGLFQGIRTKLTKPKHRCSPCSQIGSPFHLVLTNLVPWITTHTWTNRVTIPYHKALLTTYPPPTSAPHDFVGALSKRIGQHVVCWIGHGATVRLQLTALLGVSGLNVFPRFTSNNLTGPCAPCFAVIP